MESEAPSLPDVRCIVWLDGSRGIDICVEIKLTMRALPHIFGKQPKLTVGQQSQ
jgi:hypothetical protein